MATVDDKVVSMSFESSKFEDGVSKSLSAIEKLKAALQFKEAGKGLIQVGNASHQVDLGHIASGAEEVKAKLGALNVAAVAIFVDIAKKAVTTGIQIAKAFTIEPAKAGFAEYTTNLNSIQTILANTQAAGATLKDVNKALDELNDYSDKTIYNFGQMARNIGTFTAAGVDLKTATASIKGIANLAALSGSNAEQAATAMYQLSQAISSGSVKLMDWNSVVNAGMGGTVFQRALATTGEHMGALKKGTVELVGPMKNVKIAGESFRNSLSAPGKDGWLTSKVLTKTLKMFTGDMTDAELAADGWNKEQIKAIQTQAKAAMLAATNVKTLGQVLTVAKETAGSGWAKTWRIVFGDFEQAKKTFTNLSNAINSLIIDSANARNNLLGDWKALGGRTVLINAIKSAFQALGEIVKPIKEAFRDIFPATTGKQLYDLTVRFKQLADALHPSQETVDNLKRTFRGFFAVLDIGKQLIGGIFIVFRKLFGALDGGGSSFLQITGNLGDWLVALDEALKKGDGLTKFFEGLGTVLAFPLKLLGKLGEAIANLFAGFSPGDFSVKMDGATKAMTPFKEIVDAIVTLIQQLGPAISTAVDNMNFEAILQVIRTGLLGGIFLMMRSFFGKGSAINQLTKGFGGGILANISGSFRALQGSLVAMQNNIKAKTLKEIAIAVALLALSIVALSLVDPKRLNSALVAITFAFGELLGAMAIMDKIGKSGGFIKMPFIAASMILLAGAIDILAIAVIALGQLSWEQLAKGLGGIAVLLTGISIAAGPLSKNSAGMIRAGVGMTAIAIALKILASAVADFGGMSMTELGKGLGSVAVGLVIIAGAMQLMPKSMVLTGAGLVAVSVGLKIIAGVVAKFGSMDWKTIGKGMVGIAGALIVIAGAMHLMPGNMILTAAGLLLVSVALQGIAKAVKSMGGMSINEIAKGLGTLAGSLAILAAALYLMSGTLAGAAALTVAAAGISLLAPALVKLGGQSWVQIVKGLTALAIAIGLIAGASLILSPSIPAMLGLGAALVVIGAGLALAGAGVFLIATGLSALLVALPTGVGIIVTALEDLLKAIPEIVSNVVLGLLEIVNMLAAVAPKFVAALVKILDQLLNVIILSSPKIAKAFTALLDAALKVLRDNEGKIVQAGFDLLLALLQGISNNISKIVTAVVGIITKIISTIASNLSKIIASGVQILTSLIKGIANSYALVATAGLTIITKFLGAIANGLGKVVTAGLSILTNLLRGIANNLGKAITAGTDVIVAFIKGVGNAGPRIITAATNTIIAFMNSLSKNSVRLADAGATAIINFLNGVAKVIRTREPEMIQAGANIGKAIVQGMISGLGSLLPNLLSKAGDLADKVLDKLKKPWKMFSPSKVAHEIGQNIVLGLANGMTDHTKATEAATAMSNGVITAVETTLQTKSPSKVMQDIGRYVVQGFAEGIKGSSDQIKGAFTDLNNKLVDGMREARATAASEEDKLAELLKEKHEKIREINATKFKKEGEKAKALAEVNKQYADAIAESQKAIKDSEALLARTTAGHVFLTKSLRDTKNALVGLANDYQKVGEKLEKARDILKEATNARDTAIKGYAESYGALPDIVKEDAEGKPIDQLAAYTTALTNQIAAEKSYKATLDQLRALGLDDETYKKLLDEGVVDQAFADQLLAGGKTAVDSLNTLDSQLEKVSKTLATTAGQNLYQAGVDAAQGVVDGLASKESEIAKAMEAIATQMIKAIKKKLKIKSPSQAFAEIGKFSMEGMAAGFSDSSKIVTDSIDAAGQDALTAMQKSIRDISGVVADELNPNPVITPILDLTQIQTQAQELAKLTNVTPITAAASFQQAAAISSAQMALDAEQAGVTAVKPSVKFEQNNYSPEALTEVEIYRQTKNQLSQLKSALALT
jgi:tape measure domain-containing protein